MLQVGTTFHSQVSTLALSHILIDILENHIFEADALCTRNQSIEIKTTDVHVHNLAILELFELKHVVGEDGSAPVQLVHYKVDLLVEDVVEKPLVIVWVVMPQVDVHLVCQLHNLVIA